MQGIKQTNWFWPELVVLTTMVATTIFAFLPPSRSNSGTPDKVPGELRGRRNTHSSATETLVNSSPQPTHNNFFAFPHSEVATHLSKTRLLQIRSLPRLSQNTPLKMVKLENLAPIQKHNLIQSHPSQQQMTTPEVEIAIAGIPSIPRLMSDEITATDQPNVSPANGLKAPNEVDETPFPLRRLPSLPQKYAR